MPSNSSAPIIIHGGRRFALDIPNGLYPGKVESGRTAVDEKVPPLTGFGWAALGSESAADLIDADGAFTPGADQPRCDARGLTTQGCPVEP